MQEKHFHIDNAENGFLIIIYTKICRLINNKCL